MIRLRRAARRFERAIPGIPRRDAIKHAARYLESMVDANNGRSHA